MNWNVLWALFVIVPLLAFGIFEFLGRHGHTLSSYVRRWLGISPPKPYRRRASLAFVVVLVGFDVWFIPHIVWSVW